MLSIPSDGITVMGSFAVPSAVPGKGLRPVSAVAVEIEQAREPSARASANDRLYVPAGSARHGRLVLRFGESDWNVPIDWEVSLFPPDRAEGTPLWQLVRRPGAESVELELPVGRYVLRSRLHEWVYAVGCVRSTNRHRESTDHVVLRSIVIRDRRATPITIESISTGYVDVTIDQLDERRQIVRGYDFLRQWRDTRAVLVHPTSGAYAVPAVLGPPPKDDADAAVVLGFPGVHTGSRVFLRIERPGRPDVLACFEVRTHETTQGRLRVPLER